MQETGTETIPNDQRMGFAGMNYVEKIIVEEGIESIDTEGIPTGSLKEIQLPSGMTRIADSLFNGAKKLEKVYLTGEEPEEGVAVKLPEKITVIGTQAFNSCEGLVGELRLPASLTEIKNYAFQRCSGLTGDLVIPERVTRIGDSAFVYCSSLGEHLYLGDGLQWIGDSALQGCPGMTNLHTGLRPVANIKNYSSTFTANVIHSIWYRGTDDTDTITVNGQNVGWTTLFTGNSISLSSVNRIYIDRTVDRLSVQSFWKNYADIRFVGPNVVTFNGEVFPAAPAPLSMLDGTYYVTEEGVLYALDPATGTAALSYCPPGITELYIPPYLTATEEMTGEADKRYARSYKVAGVTQHAVMAATDLTAVTAANPRAITLSMRAFADCPTLSSVNGVTTQKEANALFGMNGTPVIKKAFVNTGLDGDDTPPAAEGKPMRTLKYTNPNGGVLTVQLDDMEKYEYREDAYRMLTGEGRTFTVSAQAYGTGNLATQFCINFEPADSTFRGMKSYTAYIPYDLNGTRYTTELKVFYDRISGCYCIRFSLPAGATTTLIWDDHLGQGQVMYPTGTGGGDLTIWGEVPDFTEIGGSEEGEEEDEIFGGFSGSENYMVVNWRTDRNLYELSMGDWNNQARINSSTHRPYYERRHGTEWYGYSQGYPRFVFRNNQIQNGWENGNGKDPVTKVSYHYTITLPEGMTWADEETIARSGWPNRNNSVTDKTFSVGADGRTLTYDFSHTVTDNRLYSMTSSGAVTGCELGYSYAADSIILFSEDWDFYHDLGQRIEYKCTPTFYYQFSGPDTGQEVTAYENLKPTEAGMVELNRRYSFQDDKRGRGLPMRISFVAENKGKDAAVVNLQEITDEVVNFNGYLYLSAEQMAEAALSESEYLEMTKIEIHDAVLYQGGSYELGVTHTGTDGAAQVQENLLNTYSEPNPSNKVTLTLTVGWPEAADGGAAAGGSRRPTELTLSVNGAQRAVTSVDAGDTAATLGEKLETALQEAGYLLPTGLYRITWRATDAARSRVIGPYTDTEGQSYLWEIGAYHATVKPDYLQGHRWLTSDRLHRLSLFPPSSVPSAQAVFTIKNENNENVKIEETCFDKSYNESELELNVRSFDSRTGDEVLVGNNQRQWICPGVILDYQVDYTDGNSIAFGDIPFMQTFDQSQCLLAPADRNPQLAGAGFPKISDSEYVGGQFRGRDYYMLIPGETEQTLTGVWLGGEDGDFYVESVSMGGTDGEGTARQTVAHWYEKDFGPYQGGSDAKSYRFYAYVLAPVNLEERPQAKSVVYANNYVKEERSDPWSTRLYASYEGFYQSEAIHKDIIVNPEAAGTAQEKTSGDQRDSYLGTGASVTYRLAFDEYWIGDYTLPAGELCDLLPCTYGAFAWELGENVQVSYALKERIAQKGRENHYEVYTPTEGEGFARIEKVTEPIYGKGEDAEQYRLSFGAFTIPYNRTLYVYVTLTFPEGETWDSYAEAADVYLYNTLHYGELRSEVTHMIARPTQAFLKTGMYGTDGDPYGYVYPNSDEENRIVKYYVVIYNHGKGYLYLNPVHIQIPEGFTLKVPPKFTYSGLPDWNLGDVSVTDEEPPANINRMGIRDVKVTYPDENEAVLDIELNTPWNNYTYDTLVKKYFLRPGQYIAMEVRFETGGYQETADEVTLPAAMPIDDSHHVGRIAQVRGVDAHRSNYVNSNEGIPEFWEDNETAESRGFTIPEYADAGKWAASETDLTREEAKPGVIKTAPARMNVEGEEKPYDPQEGVSLVHPVKWETKLVNGGANSLTKYRAKDSVQWPYVFEGEVKLTSQIDSIRDQRFVISRYTQMVTPEDGGDPVEQTDRSRLQVDGQEVRIAENREEALAEGSGCSAAVFGGATVYFYKEDVFGDGHPAETMELDFTKDRTYGIGPASYQNGRIVEKSRTFSYWTKFDLSMKNVASRTSYANRMVMQPLQPYTKADVCEGTAIDQNGDPMRNDADTPDGIMAIGYVSVNVGQFTAAWMKVKENRKPGEEDQGPAVSDDIAEVLTKENKILIGDTDNTVTYTMHVLNHVASGDPNDTVQSAEDRRYSIKDMVIINTLPYMGDKMPFNSKVPRGSDYEIVADRDSFNISLYYYDPLPGGETEAEIPEERLSPIPKDCYQILCSESKTVNAADWKFIEESGSGWNGTVPMELRNNGWQLATSVGDASKIRSVRIEIKDPNTVFDPDHAADYRSLMKGGRIIVVKYQARVKVETDESGTVTPTPGKCAWNSFGYRFDRFDGSASMEASSIRTGVQIPSIPILYERLIDYDQNPYSNPGNSEEFVFTIDKQEGERADGTHRTAQQLRFGVTVDTGKSENYRELRNIKDNTEITWWKGQADSDWDQSFFWEDGASYVVKQVTAPDTLPLFSIKVNGQQTTGFVYDPLYEPVIVVTNQSKVWGSQLYKMDVDSRGWDPADDKDKEHINFLPGALFGLYTTDRMQAVDIAQIKEEAGERYEWRERYKALLHTMMEASYGEGDTAVKLYLKDFAVTGENGEIRWLNLEDDTYYVRELSPPPAYSLDETFHRINRKNAVVSVYDEPGIRFPITGGIGTLPLYITGGILMAADAVYLGRRGRRRRKSDRNENAGRTKKRLSGAGLIRVGGVALTFAMAVKIFLRVLEIRRERRSRG